MHTMMRVLERFRLESTTINANGYGMLNLMDNTIEDSFDLYYSLFV